MSISKLPTEPLSPKPGRIAAVLPLLVLAGILFGVIGWVAPNFKIGELRTDPPGGDFLQEYAGGKLWADSATRGDLYSREAFRAAQHDSEALGFSWPTEKYFPAVYPPFWYAVVSPLTQLEYMTAARVWLAMMILALVGSLALLKFCERVPTPLLLVLCLSAPVLISLGSGQKGTLLLLILTASYSLFRANKPLLSGAVFALIAFKPHLGLPIGLFMLATGQWRWVAGTFTGLFVLFTASVVSGPGICIDYVRVCLGFGDYIRNGGYRLEQGFSLWSGWQMLIADPRIAKAMTLISAAGVLLAAMVCLRDRLNGQKHEQATVFAAMTLVTVIISPHLYLYDLTMLILPACLLTRNVMDQPATLRAWLPVGLVIGVMFGSFPLCQMATATGFHPGAFLLLAALVLLLRSSQIERSPANDTVEERISTAVVP